MRTLTTLAILCGLTTLATADDKKADPTGTWKVSSEVNGRKFERTLKLELKDGKLTGTVQGQNNQETKIEDGKFKDGEVSFTLTRERNGQKMVTKYKAKLDGDTLKGTAETEVDGQTRKQEIDGKRAKKDD